MNKILKNLFLALICVLAMPAAGMNEPKEQVEKVESLKKSLLGKMAEESLENKAEHPNKNNDNKSEDNKEQDETNSQYFNSESSDSDVPENDRNDIANLSDVKSDCGDDSEPTFWHSARRIVSQTFASLYLGFVNGIMLGGQNFTKKHSIGFGIAATYTTAALCGGIKSPVGLKRTRDDKHRWSFSITARQTWLTGTGFIGYLAGRANSQKIADFFLKT